MKNWLPRLCKYPNKWKSCGVLHTSTSRGDIRFQPTQDHLIGNDGNSRRTTLHLSLLSPSESHCIMWTKGGRGRVKHRKAGTAPARRMAHVLWLCLRIGSVLSIQSFSRVPMVYFPGESFSNEGLLPLLPLPLWEGMWEVSFYLSLELP